MVNIILLHFRESLFIKKLLLVALVSFPINNLQSQTATQIYFATSSGSITIPAGVTSLTVECWGAGGKGSDSNTIGVGRGGGGGGAYASSILTVVRGTTYSFVVGSGGNSSNPNGGDTYFGANLVKAAGGSGLTVGVSTGAAGGTIANSIGTVRYRGGTGGTASGVNSGGGGGGAGSTGNGNNATGSIGGAAKADYGGSGGTGGVATFLLVYVAAQGTAGGNYGGGGGGSAAGTLLAPTGANGANGLIRISYQGLPIYCTPSSSTSTYYINNVSVQGAVIDFSNSSMAYSTGGYKDYSTNFLGQQFAGGALNFSVELNQLQFLKAWVDWNRDGDFDDVGENIYTSGAKIFSTVFGVAIPSSTPIGYYKVRIRSYEPNSSFNSCDNLSNGETEDYLLQVIPDCTALITTVFNGTRCGSGPVSLQASGSTGVTQYRWYDVEVGGSVLATTSTGSWNTPVISETKSYYVTAFNGTCESLYRTRVDAIVYSSTDVIVSPQNPQFCREGDIVKLEVESYQSTEELINENFDSGIYSFQVNTISNSNGIPWDLATSVHTTSTTVWKPAIASGRTGNKFAFAFTSADVSGTNINTALQLTNNVNTVNFSELTLTFRHYYSDYYTTDPGDYGYIEVSTNGGSTWTIFHTFNSDQGIPSRFKTEIFNFNAYIGFTQLKIRFRYASIYADGWAIDDIRLYGKKNLSVPIEWVNSDNILYTDAAATIPYTGQNVPIVYAKPEASNLSSPSWTFVVESSLENGCVIQKEITVNNRSRTWTGGTSNWNLASNWLPMSIPTIDNCVTIPNTSNHPVISSGDGYGKNLLVKSGATLTVNSNRNLYIKEDINVSSTGELVFHNNSNLVQIDNVSNTGNIIYHRTTAPMNINDYTYWGTPVSGQITSNLFDNPNNIFKWNPSTQLWVSAVGETMATGYGYIMRAPSNFPSAGQIKQPLYATFIGNPNNGDVTASVLADPNSLSSNPFTNAKMSFLSNPYPSAINIDEFFTDVENSGKIMPTIYLWTHSTDPILNSSGTLWQYVSSDFATYNLLGGTGTQPAPNDPLSRIPTGKVASGQGFFIKGSNTGGNVKFKNSYRTDNSNNAYNNADFYRIFSDTLEIKHRYWLSLKNENYYKQTLIGYVVGGTNELDIYDGDLYDGGNYISIYSLVGEGRNLSIQSRQFPFDEYDEVPLGMKLYVGGNFTIQLDNFDGLFAEDNANQPIYLKDNLLDIVHNLKDSPYQFYSETGEYNNRFSVVYRQELRIEENPIANNWTVYSKDKQLQINSKGFNIKEVILYDLQGRVIYQTKDLDANNHIINHLVASSIYLVKIISTDSLSSIKKVYHN